MRCGIKLSPSRQVWSVSVRLGSLLGLTITASRLMVTVPTSVTEVQLRSYGVGELRSMFIMILYVNRLLVKKIVKKLMYVQLRLAAKMTRYLMYLYIDLLRLHTNILRGSILHSIKLLLRLTNLLIVGDFNPLCWSRAFRLISQLATEHNLHQLVTFPTRKKNNSRSRLHVTPLLYCHRGRSPPCGLCRSPHGHYNFERLF